MYQQLCSWENLLEAWRRARRGKRSRPAVASFEQNAVEELLRLQEELSSKTWRPRGYSSFLIHDPKRRLISAASFRDRVVHHALCRLIEPCFERRFISTSFANRRGFGTHAALNRCQLDAKRYRYVLPCDVEQFFAAVDHEVLDRTLQLSLKDADVLQLCRKILESGRGVLTQQYDMRYFDGDDLLAAFRPRGLPIGNLTSQLWANVYLDPLDHFVKRTLRCHGYVRYVDDILLFGDDKDRLWEYRAQVIDFLARLRLTLHEGPCQARPTSEGVPFLGFHVFPHYRRLKRRKGIAYRRKMKRLIERYQDGDLDREALFASIDGWVAHVRQAQTHGLRKKLFLEHPPLLRPGDRI